MELKRRGMTMRYQEAELSMLGTQANVAGPASPREALMGIWFRVFAFFVVIVIIFLIGKFFDLSFSVVFFLWSAAFVVYLWLFLRRLRRHRIRREQHNRPQTVIAFSSAPPRQFKTVFAYVWCCVPTQPVRHLQSRK